MRRLVLALLLVVILTILPGCRTVYYNQRFPILERPGRPALANVPGSEMQKMSSSAQEDISGNFDSLIDYVKKLEAAIDTYNDYAREKNENITVSSRDDGQP